MHRESEVSWYRNLNPSFLPAVPGCFGFGVHVVTLGICPLQLDLEDVKTC